jgi:formate dehydrogenase maturation protein FdhE
MTAACKYCFHLSGTLTLLDWGYDYLVVQVQCSQCGALYEIERDYLTASELERLTASELAR